MLTRVPTGPVVGVKLVTVVWEACAVAAMTPATTITTAMIRPTIRTLANLTLCVVFFLTKPFTVSPL